MKKLIIIFSLFAGLIHAQHVWTEIGTSAGASVPETSFLQYGDSIFYSQDLYRAYVGFIYSATPYPYAFNSNQRGHTGAGTWGWHQGNSFIHNNKYYNLFNTLYHNGAFWQYISQFSRYNFDSTMTILSKTALSNGTQSSNVLDEGAIIGDTLYSMRFDGGCMSCGSGYPLSYNLIKYSFTNNNWIIEDTTLTNPIFGWYNYHNTASFPYSQGLFNLGDTLYQVTGFGTAPTALNGVVFNGIRDTLATIWKRDITTHAWTKLREFVGAGILLGGQKVGNTQYLLFESTDSTNSDAGVWKFDGTTFSQLPKPPSLHRVVGFYVLSDSTFWESVANSVIPDSNKIYYYTSGSWDGGEAVYSTYSQKNILINNICWVSGSKALFVGYKTRTGIIGTGATKTIAYSTVYKSIALIEPVTGYYVQGDTLKVKWEGINAGDSVGIFINYSGVYDSVKTAVGVDSAYILLDSLSNNVTIKLQDYTSSLTTYSESFIIKPQTFLEIDTVIYSPSSGAFDIITLHNGIDSVKYYVGADTTIAMMLLEKRTVVNNGAVIIDTVTYSLTSLTHPIDHPYFKVEEIKDTAVYGKTLTYYDRGSLMYLPGSFCNYREWDGSGTYGGLDPSCAWAANATWTAWKIELTVINNDTMVVVGEDTVFFSEHELFISAGHSEWSKATRDIICGTGCTPTLLALISFYSPPNPSPEPSVYWHIIPDPGGNYFGQIINGRRYSIRSDGIYMTDMVNTVTYKVYDCWEFWAATADPPCEAEYMALINGHLVFVTGDYYTVYLFSALDYPPDSSPALHDIFRAEVTPIIYRNVFRGIIPKSTQRLVN